jgi:ubiquitin carboxyl-terminal hydrolase L3
MSASNPFVWPPLESNPEIFSDLTHQMGLPSGWTFNEIYGFDEDLLGFIPTPVLAVICNLERLGLSREDDRARGNENLVKDVGYYMKQNGTLDNACGLIAVLHGIYNNVDKITLQEGKPLHSFLQAVKDKSPNDKAVELMNYADIHNKHVEFATQGQSQLLNAQEEVKHHYITFTVNAKGQLLEFDGTKQGPVIVKEGCGEQGVLRAAVGEIQRRLKEGEITDKMSMMTLNAA